MKLSDHDLSQLTEDELLDLPEAVLRQLSIKLLTDLKEARERLKQNSHNSSRPPRSDAPWDRNEIQDDETIVDTDPVDQIDSTEETSEADKSKKEPDPPKARSDVNSRRPGKQPGAPGYGRTQTIRLTDTVAHYPSVCARCGAPLDMDHAHAYTAFDTLDLVWANAEQPGIRLTNTRHTYYAIDCSCGHSTQDRPYRQNAEPGWVDDVFLSEWRLVGPGLAALIVCLAYRMRLSRARIQEFLHDWLGLELSVGTIHATLHESGAAALSVETELAEAVRNSGLLHIDETPWPESSLLLWLWVFSGSDVVAYWIATRSAELLDSVLESMFQGWLMSDGWLVYRSYAQRLRCWAHLLRKARGLAESLTPEGQQFGKQTLQLLNTLIDAVYAARSQPPDQPLTESYQQTLADYRATCETLRDSTHEKTRTLAREMLNDWEAIFQVLAHPHLPLTNNEAERALRHWVILRGICLGTRTENGTRLFAILISVIETCRVRQQSPWLYLAEVIRHRRAGLPAPKLPPVLKVGSE
jgi:transposase